MRLYDHIIRIFPFTPGHVGDLRTGKLGVFGSLQSRTQLFARHDPAYSVSNRGLPTNDTSYRRYIRQATVHGYFAKEDANGAIAPEALDQLVVDGLSLSIQQSRLDLSAGDVQTLPHVYVPSAQTQISSGYPKDAFGDIVIEPDFEWTIVATISEPLLMQLNGALQNGPKWEPGDPVMTRVLRVDLEYQQESA